MEGFIKTSRSRMRPNGKGRTPIEDGEMIVAHFVQGLASGGSVSSVAARGLTICGYRLDADGKPQPYVRRLRGSTLERRFRKLQPLIAAELENRKLWNPTWGMRVPQQPNGFAVPVKLKRGRPRLRRG